MISPDIEVIDPPSALDHFAVNGAGTEFILIGGKIATSAAYYTPKIQALASLIQYGEYPHVRIAAANSMTLRVPAIASAGVAAPVKGDLIFNNTNGKGQMYDGVVWRDLW